MTNKSSQPVKTNFASSNWLALQKRLEKKSSRRIHNDKDAPRKRRKITRTESPLPSQDSIPTSLRLNQPCSVSPSTPQVSDRLDLKNGETLPMLRDMVFGHREIPENQRLPGKYLSLDCEMVGIGIDGNESSLARVSIVNFHGFVQLDEFVRQREQVVDYRTRHSGIRASDMVKAKHFNDVQKRVADLLKDRILIGHAVHNDLKALLLSHPRQMIRDTQYLSGKHKVVKSKFIALRNLVKQELDSTIQAGEHSSVTDARAAMAIYRLHRKDWEKAIKSSMIKKGKKTVRKVDGNSAAKVNVNSEAKTRIPDGGRRGVNNEMNKKHVSSEKKKWWKELAGSI